MAADAKSKTKQSYCTFKLKCYTHVKIASFHPRSFPQTSPHSLVRSKLDSTRHEIGVLTEESVMLASSVFVPVLVSMTVKL